MKFSIVPTFSAKATMSWPSEEDPGQFRRFDFDCRFKAIENSPEARAELQRKQDEDGIYAFLDEVLSSVKLPEIIEPVDEHDAAMDPLEWVKRNAFAGAAASIAFWDVVNRDLEAKNSKRSRGR